MGLLSRRLPAFCKNKARSSGGASGRSAGVTTFDRARCAVLYLEAAAGVPEEHRLGSNITLKGSIKELVLGISQKRVVEKRQAPQHLSRVLESWEGRSYRTLNGYTYEPTYGLSW